jgi:hypothetical protein
MLDLTFDIRRLNRQFAVQWLNLTPFNVAILFLCPQKLPKVNRHILVFLWSTIYPQEIAAAKLVFDCGLQTAARETNHHEGFRI